MSDLIGRGAQSEADAFFRCGSRAFPNEMRIRSACASPADTYIIATYAGVETVDCLKREFSCLK